MYLSSLSDINSSHSSVPTGIVNHNTNSTLENSKDDDGYLSGILQLLVLSFYFICVIVIYLIFVRTKINRLARSVESELNQLSFKLQQTTHEHVVPENIKLNC